MKDPLQVKLRLVSGFIQQGALQHATTDEHVQLKGRDLLYCKKYFIVSILKAPE